MLIAGWILGIIIILVGIWLWRYPSRYGRGFVQAISLVFFLGGIYVIWVAYILAGHSILRRSLF
ncbi:MAG: hypothetical protein C7B46_19550 [Sulfobacillus benefaciens]|uniref:Uncharacterized protein n=1 Tax=Sulfobacillus benefaciens TaxID=453960 RepID=A0A2T2WYD7_9FIRM|nr:MAG: hypothetical protein C7B46_19550 [Sulfobacillus benefaciens]